MWSAGRRFRTDELVLALSEELSTDHMRVYCYALGLTKDVVETICKSRAGDSLSPTEKNYQVISLSRISLYMYDDHPEKAMMTMIMLIICWWW